MFGFPAATAPGAAPGSAVGTTPPVAGSTAPNATSTPTVAGANGAATVPAGNLAGLDKVGGQLITLKSDVLAVDVDTVGGVIRRVELLTHKDTIDATKNITLLQSGNGNVFIAETGFVSSTNQLFPRQDTTFTVAEGVRSLAAGAGDLSLVLTAESGGLKVQKTITLKRASYEIDVKHDVTNTSAETLSPQLFLQLTRDANKPAGESQFYSTFTGPAIYTEQGKFQKMEFTEIEKGKATYVKQASDGWLGVIQHYFVTAWIPTDKSAREYLARKIAPNVFAVSANQALAPMAAGSTQSVTSRLLTAPQDQRMLEKVSPGLDLSVDYGVFSPIAKPLYWLLDWCHTLVKNWGWAIVLMTLIVKLAFFPLQAFAYKSMAKMKTVGPKVKALQEKYGDDRLKLNQAMMEMYKTEKINPMGSCLPIMLQIPVFISLYWVLLASVEVRNAPWIAWIHDLASPDPLYILPVILAATSFLQTKMSPTPPDPVQAKMMTIMPLVFSIMFFFFPAGLVLYYIVNNVFSIAQQWYITRKIEGAAANPIKVGKAK